MRSEDTPKCKRCGGDGFTSEHGCNPNYPESCAYTCPVQVQCEACEATGLEPPQDSPLGQVTSLDDILDAIYESAINRQTLKHYPISKETTLEAAKQDIIVWHKAEIAKLLAEIERLKK